MIYAINCQLRLLEYTMDSMNRRYFMHTIHGLLKRIRALKNQLEQDEILIKTWMEQAPDLEF